MNGEDGELLELDSEDVEIDPPALVQPGAPLDAALSVQTPAGPPPEGVEAVLQFLENDPARTLEDSASRALAVARALAGQRQRLRDAEGVTLYLMGGCIDRLKRDDRWKLCPEVADYWTFGAFCREMLGLSLQTVNTLRRIWHRSQQVSLAPYEIEHLGWHAANQLLRVAKNREDVTQWLAVYGQVSTRAELVERLQRATATDEKPKRTLVRRVLRLTAEEARFYDETLERAAKSVGKELFHNMDANEATMLICTQWMLARTETPVEGDAHEA